MPRIHKEKVPNSLLVNKPSRAPRLSKKLRKDVSKWTNENIQNHWFLTQEEVEKDLPDFGRGLYIKQFEIFINFTCEYDALSWKLRWV